MPTTPYLFLVEIVFWNVFVTLNYFYKTKQNIVIQEPILLWNVEYFDCISYDLFSTFLWMTETKGKTNRTQLAKDKSDIKSVL